MIDITPEALEHLQKQATENNKRFVRLSVKGGGCAGFEYEWSFDDEDTRDDMVIKEILLVDRMFELYLLGTTLDFKKEIAGSHLVISNPKAKSSCGCGESFAI